MEDGVLQRVHVSRLIPRHSNRVEGSESSNIGSIEQKAMDSILNDGSIEVVAPAPIPVPPAPIPAPPAPIPLPNAALDDGVVAEKDGIRYEYVGVEDGDFECKLCHQTGNLAVCDAPNVMILIIWNVFD